MFICHLCDHLHNYTNITAEQYYHIVVSVEKRNGKRQMYCLIYIDVLVIIMASWEGCN